MSAIIYAWTAKFSPAETIVVIASAGSPAEAAEKIALKLAVFTLDTDKIIQIEKNLHEAPPMVMDFSEGVGFLTIGLTPQQ